ncbi:MAG: NifU family protein [Candidatus Hydrothermarchaeota archaeon]
MEREVREVLAEIRSSLQADGGDIELLEIKGGVVKVRLTGACSSCPMSQMTMKQGVEAVIKERVPGVKSVEAV